MEVYLNNAQIFKERKVQEKLENCDTELHDNTAPQEKSNLAIIIKFHAEEKAR